MIKMIVRNKITHDDVYIANIHSKSVLNKIIVIGVISAIIIGIVVLYTTYQHSPNIESNQLISIKPQTQNTTNSTVPQPTNNDIHRVFHITLNDGIGVKSR